MEAVNQEVINGVKANRHLDYFCHLKLAKFRPTCIAAFWLAPFQALFMRFICQALIDSENLFFFFSDLMA
jgi:hypothetical protein